MAKPIVHIPVDDTGPATVEILAPRIARVVASGADAKIGENDIVLLSHDPSDSAPPPRVIEVLYKQNPVASDIEFQTGGDHTRIIALAAVLGAEVVLVEDISVHPAVFAGKVRVAHPGHVDFQALAAAAGITPPDQSLDDRDGRVPGD
jgi:hypothetical protein